MTCRLLLTLCLSFTLAACSDGDKPKPGTGDAAADGKGGDAGPSVDAAKDTVTADTPVGTDTKGPDAAASDAKPAVDMAPAVDTESAASDSGSGSSSDAEPVECNGDNACAVGVCSGASCSDTWTCVADGRACTKDLVDYCGCDGMTFRDSGTCPRKPFAFRGKCEDGVSCDARKVTQSSCSTAKPSCASEEDVPRVVGNCWDGTCVPFGHCTCDTVADCPAGKFLCEKEQHRCVPALMGAVK